MQPAERRLDSLKVGLNAGIVEENYVQIVGTLPSKQIDVQLADNLIQDNKKYCNRNIMEPTLERK